MICTAATAADWLFGRSFARCTCWNLDDNLLTDAEERQPGERRSALGDGDFAFGGAGRDVLIANMPSTGCRPLGWRVQQLHRPVLAVRNLTVDREFSPNARDLIVAISFGAGQDVQLAATPPAHTPSTRPRSWFRTWALLDTNSPRDPQPGNIPGVAGATTPGAATSRCDFMLVHITKPLGWPTQRPGRDGRGGRSASSCRRARASGGRTRRSRRTSRRRRMRGS